jgi:hypothetical protein
MAAGGKHQAISFDRPAAPHQQVKTTASSYRGPLQAHPRVQLHPSLEGRSAQGGCHRFGTV